VKLAGVPWSAHLRAIASAFAQLFSFYVSLSVNFCFSVYFSWDLGHGILGLGFGEFFGRDVQRWSLGGIFSTGSRALCVGDSCGGSPIASTRPSSWPTRFVRGTSSSYALRNFAKLVMGMLPVSLLLERDRWLTELWDNVWQRTKGATQLAALEDYCFQPCHLKKYRQQTMDRRFVCFKEKIWSSLL